MPESPQAGHGTGFEITLASRMTNATIFRLPHPFVSSLAILLLSACTMTAPAQQVAFTWDDLPAHSSLPPGETRASIIQSITQAMKAEKMPPVYGFLNGVRVTEEPASVDALAAWQKAGLPVGNHTWSHLNLNEQSASVWEADFDRNEPTLRQFGAGQPSRWMRFPYLAEGETEAKRNRIRAFLAKRHYRIAGVTMSFNDFAYNAPYARCVARKDEAGIAELEKGYIAAADSDITYRRTLAKGSFGHDIPYVLLMHVGAFDARMLPRLLELYRKRGFAFITLEQAEADPFYANDLDLTLPSWPDTLEGVASQRHVSLSGNSQPALDVEKVCP